MVVVPFAVVLAVTVTVGPGRRCLLLLVVVVALGRLLVGLAGPFSFSHVHVRLDEELSHENGLFGAGEGEHDFTVVVNFVGLRNVNLCIGNAPDFGKLLTSFAHNHAHKVGLEGKLFARLHALA